MGNVYDRIDTDLAHWIEAQPLFFVATAPLAADGLVNLSPKGTSGTFRVLDEHTFAYLDIIASGIETVAHLRENGRVCVMLCAFDGKPNVVRLHGTGRVVLADDPAFDDAIAPFGAAAQERRAYLRGVVVVDVSRVSDSCGYAVPKMALVGERETLDATWRSRDAERIARYKVERNATSLDGLPGLPVTEPA
ncbi:pyridoxamine 5'-phosphate oxidase family protein [Pseudonocardia humida]|uniref:Pyridoxamine 5'-phosphate oxidase family protein n=1 Tax=Pseudonocardia humida TaxID=2800819 RepID=A0ABT0ZUK1_9PSEU|nr:pyridoxamine 5'-phosphate oxidase family protein [Pseudonocardia humida]MCO1654411.1 pyridoxamine 5'-phosphate oxidase family protein [Pseudonocardia humida]